MSRINARPPNAANLPRPPCQSAEAAPCKDMSSMKASIALVIPLTVALCTTSAHAQQAGRTPLTVKIGVLSDMSGLYADIGGAGLGVGARQVCVGVIPPKP